MKRFAIILAGGQGIRFWPMSQPRFPKQFLTVFNNTPLITQTINRVKSFFDIDERILIIPKQLKAVTRKFARRERIIVEPERRNTAPAICLAAMWLRRRYGNAILHVMPADHIVTPVKSFITALQCGETMAQEGYLVTYGVKPTRPETGYGYVKTGALLKKIRSVSTFEGIGFTEKPSIPRAKQYIRSGTYLWNSGIFSFTTDAVLIEMKHLIPKIYKGVARYLDTRKPAYFQRLPDISIDYGVMEHCKKLGIVMGKFKWDDVGSWLALERHVKKDVHNNIVIGNVQGLEMNDSIVYTDTIPVRIYGARGIIIVVSQNGVLVCNKEHAPDLKKILL